MKHYDFRVATNLEHECIALMVELDDHDPSEDGWMELTWEQLWDLSEAIAPENGMVVFARIGERLWIKVDE